MAPKMNTGLDIAENLSKIKTRIAEAAAAADRAEDEIKLTAISKAHPVTHVQAALAAGHRIFGENRIQEAEEKWPDLKRSFSDARLHLVGPLQRNKLRRAIALFDVIETVDRPKLSRALANEMERAGSCPDCFIQVNTGEEPQKAGIAPPDADSFIKSCRDDLGLPIRGLMCIPPIDEEPSLHFALLKKIAARNGVNELSMGMSHDFEAAVAFGATFVRVGTAIFGERPPWKPSSQV